MRNQSIFYRRNKMNEDLYLRNETKKLIEKYLIGRDPEADRADARAGSHFVNEI